MSDEIVPGKPTVGFDSFEEGETFRNKSYELFGEGTFERVGKHTNNVVLFLPGEEEPHEVLKALGQLPEGCSARVGTGVWGKGASSLPQQILELAVYAGGVYGGVRAFYDIGKFTLSALKYLYEKYATSPPLNKAGIISLCAVDLVENQGIVEYHFLSAMEAHEGHQWDPSIDWRDIYYVTFADVEGQGHLYVANAFGAILHYAQLPFSESWQIARSFSEDSYKARDT